MPQVDIRIERTFPVPVADAYAWLTDFSSDDGRLAKVVVRDRRVLSREGDVVRLWTLVDAPGGPRERTMEVRLFPHEHRWESVVASGFGEGSRNDYRLSPAAGGGTRLDVRYGIVLPNPLQALVFRLFLRGATARRFHTMWDNYTAAMIADLGAAPRA